MKEGENSQTDKALAALRLMIIDGSVRPGQRLSEAMVIERSGVSRTPARMAMMRLVEEGLLEERSGGGLYVASFTEADLYDAVEIRGVLEGTAARLAAERGVSRSILLAMSRCVAELDEVLARDDSDFESYCTLNAEFHRLLGEACGSPIMDRLLAYIMRLPFAAPNAFIRDMGPEAKRFQIVTQEQHRDILDAIVNRQGTRAEAIAREHSLVSRKISGMTLRSKDESKSGSVLSLVVGAFSS